MHRTLALWALAACVDGPIDHACTEIGCSDGYSLILESAALAEGTYEVALSDGEGFSETCTFRVSHQPGDCAADRCVVDEDCNATYAVGVSGQDDVITVIYAVTGDELQLDVTLDATPVLQETYTAAYEESQPNGPGCPPTCRLGSDAFSL